MCAGMRSGKWLFGSRRNYQNKDRTIRLPVVSQKPRAYVAPVWETSKLLENSGYYIKE